MRLQLIMLTQAQAELLAEVMRQADSSKVENIEQESVLLDRFPVVASWRDIQCKVLRPGEVSFEDVAEESVVKASVQLTRFRHNVCFRTLYGRSAKCIVQSFLKSVPLKNQLATERDLLK